LAAVDDLWVWVPFGECGDSFPWVKTVMFHVEHFRKTDFHVIKKANA